MTLATVLSVAADRRLRCLDESLLGPGCWLPPAGVPHAVLTALLRAQASLVHDAEGGGGGGVRPECAPINITITVS